MNFIVFYWQVFLLLQCIWTRWRVVLSCQFSPGCLKIDLRSLGFPVHPNLDFALCVSGTFALWEHTTQSTRYFTSWLLSACSPTARLPWRMDFWVSCRKHRHTEQKLRDRKCFLMSALLLLMLLVTTFVLHFNYALLWVTCNVNLSLFLFKLFVLNEIPFMLTSADHSKTSL